MIKFTIVTCTYNAASVLQRTLNSVLSQKYADIEHLILDGLSKDETVEMARTTNCVPTSRTMAMM